MRQIHLAIFLLFATFGCHLCQSAGNGTQTTTSTVASTTPNSTTTTTPVPTTTTPTPKTTPKPTPTPTPLPSFISGNVTEDNYTCIRFEFNVHFNIKYTTNNNETKNAILQLPLDSVLGKVKNGTCTAAKESFSLLHSESLINFTMTFAKNENSVYLDSIDLFVKLDNKTFPDINKNKLDTIGNFSLGTTFSPNFNVEKSHSYFCANVTVPKNDPADLQVVFSGLKIQAFMDKTKNGDFSLEHNCQSEINDVVPIAVGAALTSLVLIVLVAYFIGRRRSRRLAYQSV